MLSGDQTIDAPCWRAVVIGAGEGDAVDAGEAPLDRPFAGTEMERLEMGLADGVLALGQVEDDARALLGRLELPARNWPRLRVDVGDPGNGVGQRRVLRVLDVPDGAEVGARIPAFE